MKNKHSKAFVELGRVGKPHGVRGALKVLLHDPTSSTARDAESGQLRLEFEGRVITPLQVVGKSDKGPIIKASEVETREAAEALRGARLMVERSAVTVEPDEFLFADLIGCKVCEADRDFGEVVDVFSTGASEILVVGDGDKERLIPLVDEWVAEVDLERRRIEVIGGEQWDLQPSRERSS